jgi:peptide deformylase
MYEDLKIIKWPDPRLRKPSLPVQQFDESLITLTTRMFQLMREAKGVGLAAPQVGINLRLFVMNATGEPTDDRVVVNPVLSNGDGAEEDEEGCLSLPAIYVQVVRDLSLHLAAQDVHGNPFEETATGFVARVWQHETDHLNGILLTDKMGPVTKITYRKKLREMEEEFILQQGKKK